MHWSTLFLTCSKLIFSKWFSSMWFLLSIPRQSLMQAFWAVCNLFFSDIDRFGYQAQHAKAKCGCIRELHNILLRWYDRQLFCLYRNFIFPLIFFNVLFAMDSPDMFSFKRHPKYSFTYNKKSIGPKMHSTI